MVKRTKSTAKESAPIFNFGGPEEDFPLGTFDDFDGEIVSVAYEIGDFNTQIAVIVRPAEYEYEPRGMEFDEDDDDDEGLPRSWYSMGKGEFEVADDGLTLVAGPRPQRNANGIKFSYLCTEHGAKLNGTDLEPLIGMSFHWNTVTWKGKIDGVERESNRLFPSGKVVGKASFGQAEVKKKTRRSQREDEEEETPDDQEVAEEEEEEEEEDDTSLAEAFDLLVEVVGEAGKSGLKRRSIADALGKKDEPEALVQLAAQRSTIKAAVKDGKLEEEDGVLTVAE
jgi:hypothetical protein